jgi:hypothetical protein
MLVLPRLIGLLNRVRADLMRFAPSTMAVVSGFGRIGHELCLSCTEAKRSRE